MPNTRDTIVIGASAGGISALKSLLSSLSADFPGSIFVVQHQAHNAGHLLQALENSVKLPLKRVESRQKVMPGTVYLAPPDSHLVLTQHDVDLSNGPRENRSRPSINVLFRTAAAYRSSRVTGILLTGMLDDGIAGLEAIQRCGGTAIVQDPNEAEYPDLPRNAIEALDIRYVKTLSEIAAMIPSLVNEEVDRFESPRDLIVEAGFNLPSGSHIQELDKIAEQVAFSCPDCGGPLWKVGKGESAVYRCHIGHAMGTLSLEQNQAEQIERSLWVAVRSLTERSELLKKLASDTKTSNNVSATRFERHADEAQTHAETARQFLLSLRLAEPLE